MSKHLDAALAAIDTGLAEVAQRAFGDQPDDRPPEPFSHTGTQQWCEPCAVGYSDTVTRCDFCGGGLEPFSPFDDPTRERMHWRPR